MGNGQWAFGNTPSYKAPMQSASSQLQVFFDGACPLCSREVRHYDKLDRHDRIQWVDIAAPTFNAPDYGLDPARVQMAMHARTPQGTIVTGVEAFIHIWRALPRSLFTAFMLTLLKIPGMMWCARQFYRRFAKNRYRLTGRCTPESCSIHPNK